VVKPQPSKLMSWVRFSSPAPYILLSQRSVSLSKPRCCVFYF